MSKILGPLFRTFAAGLLAILPIALTVLIVVWVGSIIQQFVGPGSMFGKLFAKVGLIIAPDDQWAYILGVALVPVTIYLIGVFVRTRVAKQFSDIVDRLITRIPLVGSIYGLTNRFAGILDQDDDVDLKSMSPVWCYFGGPGGAAVLALMSTSEIVMLENKPHRIVLVPSAPIPVGGGLIFVPEDWIRPCDFGVEALTNIYVSMGVAAPNYLETAASGQSGDADGPKGSSRR